MRTSVDTRPLLTTSCTESGAKARLVNLGLLLLHNYVHLTFTIHGAGTIIVGNVPVDRRYPEAIGNAIIDPTQTWNQVEAFKPMIRNAKAEGSVVIVQLTHAGRQTSNNVCEEPVSSSDVQTAPMGGMVR